MDIPCLFFSSMYIYKQTHCVSHMYGRYMGNFGREKNWRIMSCSPIFTNTPKMYLAYAVTVAYSPNFSSPNAFTCMVRQNFFLPKISRVQYLSLLFCFITFRRAYSQLRLHDTITWSFPHSITRRQCVEPQQCSYSSQNHWWVWLYWELWHSINSWGQYRLPELRKCRSFNYTTFLTDSVPCIHPIPGLYTVYGKTFKGESFVVLSLKSWIFSHKLWPCRLAI